ncbi:MAG TPA: TIGR04282 family arsenosugar biosynthesis glycosyltransferase [bacterium]|nr:TIGR04282 family arsenosugar biosynthesis glycosyltransferase [bacterium]
MTIRAGVSFLVFAKEPAPGAVKTRLSPPLAPVDAASLYAAFLEDVCATVAHASGKSDRRVLLAPDGPGPILTAIAKRYGFETAAQEGEDLGARMRHALAREIAGGTGGAVLVGSDSPTLTAESLRDAATRLCEEPRSLVLGPAADGGYWLIGCAREVPDVFSGVEWSTRQVFAQTLSRARKLKLPVSLLPLFYDVDDAADLAFLDAHLSALPPSDAPRTRAALAALKARLPGIFPS